jgi:tetratricopeptide (TPR) repeat protein
VKHWLIWASSALALSSQTLYHTTIAVEEGTPLAGTPQIIVGYGIGLQQACRIIDQFGNGSVTYITGRYFGDSNADTCPVTISLPGYRKVNATLRNGTVIVLKRLGGDHEGSTVSLSAMRAPEDAKKAYGKGLEAAGSRKWAKAQAELEKAVAIYPDYAAAWSGLGEIYLQQNKATEARTAYERALKIDPKYVKPYVQLARLDLSEKRVEEAAEISSRAIDLKPTEFPAVYFYHAVANFNLKHFDVAEASARRCVELDSEHEVPRAEFLLGSVLAAKGDRAGALQHFNKYIELAPKAPDVAEVRQRIADLR